MKNETPTWQGERFEKQGLSGSEPPTTQKIAGSQRKTKKMEKYPKPEREVKGTGPEPRPPYPMATNQVSGEEAAARKRAARRLSFAEARELGLCTCGSALRTALEKKWRMCNPCTDRMADEVNDPGLYDGVGGGL